MTEEIDKKLVAAVLQGQKQAFGELYDRYAPLIRAVCYDTTGNLADAQDLAQDVFLRAYEKLEHLRKPNRFGYWLTGIAKLRCKEWLRKKLKSNANETTLDSAHEVADQPDDSSLEELKVSIAKLPEKERLALHAFYLQEKSADNARKTMNLSRSGFYNVLDLAKNRLAKLITIDREF
jgi:RNA polymerase sigma-70 factor (ECF subfamily)